MTSILGFRVNNISPQYDETIQIQNMKIRRHDGIKQLTKARFHRFANGAQNNSTISQDSSLYGAVMLTSQERQSVRTDAFTLQLVQP